jgi:hypothetical protein
MFCNVTHSSLVYFRDTVAGLFDELVVNTKKLATATSKQFEKWH